MAFLHPKRELRGILSVHCCFCAGVLLACAISIICCLSTSLLALLSFALPYTDGSSIYRHFILLFFLLEHDLCKGRNSPPALFGDLWLRNQFSNLRFMIPRNTIGRTRLPVFKTAHVRCGASPPLAYHYLDLSQEHFVLGTEAR
jgi:hypothetical protein